MEQLETALTNSNTENLKLLKTTHSLGQSIIYAVDNTNFSIYLLDPQIYIYIYKMDQKLIKLKTISITTNHWEIAWKQNVDLIAIEQKCRQL